MIQNLNMLALAAVLYFISSVHQNSAGELDEKLVWPKDFHLKVERMDLRSGLAEKMELWSSGKKNRSRVDYYGGTTAKYYVWPQDGDVGYVYNFRLVTSTYECQKRATTGSERTSAERAGEKLREVYPYTTESKENQRECQATTIEKENYKFLPVVNKYEYAGESLLEGSRVRVWTLQMNLKDQISKDFILYTRKGDHYDVPVQLVQKMYNNARGMLTAHVVTNYFDFQPNPDPNNEIFNTSIAGCTVKIRQGEDFHNDLRFLYHGIETHVDSAFRSFKNYHKKEYSSLSENELRKHIFANNWASITDHNRGNHSYRLQVNRFADFTPEERARLRGTRPSEAPGTLAFPHSDDEVKAMAEELPKEYDMRLEGFISPIKDQGSCGSCWAFSSTAAVEGALVRSNGGRILDLSEQSMIDCSWGFSNSGCNGGNLPAAFRYILKHGIPMEEEYGAYLEQDGYCHRANMTGTYGIKGFSKVTPLNPDALKVALHKYGPVAANINFSDAMEFYSSGIFYDPTCNSGKVNHGVTVVGYGARDGTDYWIVRNSHGHDWGENGYMLLAATDDNCLVLTASYYAVV